MVEYGAAVSLRMTNWRELRLASVALLEGEGVTEKGSSFFAAKRWFGAKTYGQLQWVLKSESE